MRIAGWSVGFAATKAIALALFAARRFEAGCIVLFAPDPWLFFQILKPAADGFGPGAVRFATDRREVWLTIDDGPDPATTLRVLDLLDRHRARATFFVRGCQVERHPDLAREIVRRGHAVANHTFSHPAGNFWAASPARIGREIDACDRALRQAGVEPEPWFRPPVGIKSPWLHPQLARRRLCLVLWSARGYDGVSRDPAAAFARVKRGIRPGCIVLAHESGGRPEDRMEFLGLLLAHLSREGYACVRPAPETLQPLEDSADFVTPRRPRAS